MESSLFVEWIASTMWVWMLCMTLRASPTAVEMRRAVKCTLDAGFELSGRWTPRRISIHPKHGLASAG
jgi:hypothetical protein